MRRLVLRRGLISLAGVVALATAACEPQPTDDELQGLLHDEPLSAVTRSALSTGAAGAGGASDGGVLPGQDGGAAGGVGGRPGLDGGTAGTVSTGEGGSKGTAGDGVITGTAGFGMTGFAGTTGAAGTTGIAGSIGKAGSSGTGGSAVDGGTGGVPFFGPLGQWSFDDCNPQRTNLFDSGPNQNTAFRSVSVKCADGIGQQAVLLADRENDLVYVPDQPSFTFDGGVTVAGWFNATSTKDTRTLFRKRDDGSSSAFALVLNGGRFQFVVNLGDDRAATAVAPTKAQVGRWTHVGATYDGTTVRLYLDGKEVASKRAKGTIAPAPGPFLMGNDGSRRLWAGSIDNAFFDARALSADEMLALTCVHRTLSLTASPLASAPTPIGVPANFDVALTNNDSVACQSNDYFVQAFANDPGVAVVPSFQPLFQVAPGTTVHTPIAVTGSDDLDTGTYAVNISAFDANKGFDNSPPLTVDFNFVASGCRVSKPRELMITNLSVVDDPIRTGAAPSSDPRAGVWTFKHLMEAIAPSAAEAPAMVEAVLTSLTDSAETINTFPVPARPGMKQFLAGWPRTATGELDLSQAPFTLEAIVNRFDLRNLDAGDAGEGRFVFGFNSPGVPFPLQATIIFEYKLPATTEDDVMAWANAWHNLGTLPFPSESYNAALAAITERFAGRGARPDHPNGSAINTVRTNEIDFGDNGLWQLREFVLSPDTGKLVPATIKLTPDLTFNNTDTLASYINANESKIIAETHDVPEQFAGGPFLTGSVLNDGFTAWTAPGIKNSEARFHFALNTCNGCHSAETNTRFLQISPRFPGGGEASLSPFLQGTTVFDRASGTIRNLNDLARRQTDLKGIVCPPDAGGDTAGSGGTGGTTGSGGSGGRVGAGGASGTAGATGAGGRGVRPGSGGTTGADSLGAASPGAALPLTTSLRKGISRVH